MSLPDPAVPTSGRRVGVLVACVLGLGVSMTWTFLSLRVGLGVGGPCAEGGPHVPLQACPDGSALIAVAIPLMLLSALVGTAVALSVSAPNLFVPMWAALFGSLSWNFLDYGVTTLGSPVWSWVICGVAFAVVALPAVYAMALGLRATLVPRDGATGRPESRKWYGLYPVLGAAGVLLGVLTFNALA